jgi:hypothetical protein
MKHDETSQKLCINREMEEKHPRPCIRFNMSKTMDLADVSNETLIPPKP